MSRTSTHLRCFALICMSLLIMVGCETGSPVADAQAVAERYYTALKNNDFEAASGMFVTGLKSRDQWLQLLEANHAKLGDLESVRLTQSIVNTVFSGRRYTLTYVVKYTDFPATETVIIFEPVSKESMLIENVNVMSRGL